MQILEGGFEMYNKIKKFIKSKNTLYKFLYQIKLQFFRSPSQKQIMNHLTRYHKKRFFMFSGAFIENKEKETAYLIWLYHVIEKGLSMPEMRLGFGKEKILELNNLLKRYAFSYGTDSSSFRAAVSILLEYDQVHKESGYKLDTDVQVILNRLKEDFNNIPPINHKVYKAEEFYQRNEEAFGSFAPSRHSIRSFDSKININLEEIIEAIDLAKTAPSACNRQPARVHIIQDSILITQCLSLQNGNRGFGHLANKLLVITGNLSTVLGAQEFFDLNTNVGIFIMNLCYALHYKKIAHCVLNWYVMPKQDQKLREILGLPNEENVVAFILCGKISDSFKIAESPRFNTEKLYTVH